MKNFNQFLMHSAWFVLVLIGFSKLFYYTNAPGEPAQLNTNRWPSSQFIQNALKPSLILFVHPHCPCSRATIGELEKLMALTHDQLLAQVFFYKPSHKDNKWVKGSLWKQALSIPGVQVNIDETGHEAERFGVKTSGQTFLYTPQGELIFSGGITPGRGHSGNSEGRAAILGYLAQQKFNFFHSSVYGCSIKKPERAALLQNSNEFK